jgi:hypothetical protein
MGTSFLRIYESAFGVLIVFIGENIIIEHDNISKILFLE